MKKILVKETRLYGRMASPADKYVECPPGPVDWDIEKSYKTIDDFLKKNTQPVMPQRVRVFPFIEEGIIGPSIAASCYLFNDCLVGNMFRPYGLFIDTGVMHRLLVANLQDKISDIEETLNILKYETSWEWSSFWKEQDDRIIEVPDKFVNITEFLPYLPKLLNE